MNITPEQKSRFQSFREGFINAEYRNLFSTKKDYYVFDRLPSEDLKVFLLTTKMIGKNAIPAGVTSLKINYKDLMCSDVFDDIRTNEEVKELVMVAAGRIATLGGQFEVNGNVFLGILYNFYFEKDNFDWFEINFNAFVLDFVADCAQKYTIEEIPALVEYIKLY